MLTVFNIIDSDLKCNCYTHPILMGCILVKKEYYLPFDKYKIKKCLQLSVNGQFRNIFFAI